MKKIKKQVIESLYREFVLFVIVLYFFLLILDVQLNGFASAFFPINLLGWSALILSIMYFFFFVDKKERS